MIDPVCAYTLPEALRVGRVLEALNFYWFENPISDQDLDGLSFLAGKLGVPLAVGEQNFAGFEAPHQYLSTTRGFYVRTLAEYAEIRVPQNLLGIGMADLPTINENG